jgi:GNAT superfamily N-acetyltransferase
MELSLGVKSYPECVDALMTFRNRNRAIIRDREYFDWRYRDRPCAIPAEVVWAESGGRPVGALSIFPHDYYILDNEYTLGVLGDISVDPEFRGQGIAGAMFRFLAGIDLQRRLSGGIVLPNEEAARPLLRNGWAEANRIERYVRILDIGPRIGERFGHGMPASVLAWSINAATRWSPGEVVSGWRERGRYRSAVVTTVDERFNELWRRSDKRGRVLGVRNAAYLRWRYQHHPVSRYEIFTLTRGDDLCGYLCYRISNGACVVDDIFAEAAGEAVHELLRAFLAHARERRIADTVTVNVNRSYLHIPWRGFGFSRRADFQRVLVAPGGAGSGDLLTSVSGKAGWHIAAGDKDV